MKYIYYLATTFLFVVFFKPGFGQQPAKNMTGTTVTGFVFADLNNNGTKDNNEPGIKGVVISDQSTVSASQSDGSFTISNVKGDGIVFISLPEGYKITPPSLFWQHIDVSKDAAVCNFALIKTKPVSSFSFIHASDTHISPASIDRTRKLQQITDSVKPDLLLITGDLVKDALRVPEKEATNLYELFKTESAKINTTTWLVPGNHEIFGIERHLSLVSTTNPLYGRKMYHHYFGPDYYSFNYGGVHFVGLNSVNFEDTWYFGDIDSAQVEWLKKDLSLIPSQMPVVTFQHIPFYSGGLSIQPYEDFGPGRVIEREKGVLQYRHVVTNAEDILVIMSKYNYPLALAGHHHFQQRFTMEGIQTRFEQTAAIVAPTSEGRLKMPSGVVLYTVKDGKIDAGKFIPLDK